MGVMEGRAAIVTGASRGIGQRIAELFAAQGAAVALVARTAQPGESRLPGSLKGVAERINGSGGQAAIILADLSRPEDVETIVARAEDALGPIDTLVNNAGANFYGPVLDCTMKRYGLMFQMMVNAPFRLCQLAVPGMVERGRGWILNITSKQARHVAGPPFPDWARDGSTPYAMAKAALNRLTTGLAVELEGTGVNVNALGTSGLVVTPGTAEVVKHPSEHLAVEPDDAMPEAALRLCTGEPGNLTGQVTYSMEFLGRPFTEKAWLLDETF